MKQATNILRILSQQQAANRAGQVRKAAEIARRLVIRGFFAEIINKLKSAEIEERLMQRIEDELAKVGE